MIYPFKYKYNLSIAQGLFYLQYHSPITVYQIPEFFPPSPWKETPHPLAVTLHSLYPQSLTTINLLSVTYSAYFLQKVHTIRSYVWQLSLSLMFSRFIHVVAFKYFIPCCDSDVPFYGYACMHDQSLSCVRLFAIPWAVTHQAPLSMGFFRQGY